MTKCEMIKLLKNDFQSWRDVRDFMVGINSYCGWYTYWEGYHCGDFSLCSEGPRGDSTGEHITQNDFERQLTKHK